MFKSAIAIFVLCCLMLTNFSTMFIFSAFKLNQQYIASNLCVNRSMPELQCNGKCYLLKKIKQAEEKEKKQEQEGQKKGFQDHCILGQSFVQLQFSSEMKKDLILEKTLDLPKAVFEVLHPPPAASSFLS
jgi:hypothetical protein